MSVKVAVRLRPFNAREIALESPLIVEMKVNTTTLIDPETGVKKDFSYDYSFWSHDGFANDENV
jgi:hypothetical protein